MLYSVQILELTGGNVTAFRSRFKALKQYYENPNYCKCCGEIICVDGNQKVSAVRIKKFCSHSCSAKYSNRNRTINTDKVCPDCGGVKKKESKTCWNCYLKKVQKVKIDKITGKKEYFIATSTKEKVMNKHSNWWRSRIPIAKHARKVYKNSGKPFVCSVCGYTTHVQICHIKGVAEFDNNCLISEINNINNLVALCPNHHWELDHGFLSI